MTTKTETKKLAITAATVAMNAKAYATVTEAREGYDSVLEPKLDGWRVHAEIRGTGWFDEDGVEQTRCYLYTRTANQKQDNVPHIAAELAAAFPPGTWLDGEVVAMSVEDGHVHHWGGVQSVMGGGPKHASEYEKMTFSVFDVMSHAGIDARPLPFSKRRELLEMLFDVHAEKFNAVVLTAQLPAIEESHEKLLMEGFEGSMVKWLAAPYRSGGRGFGQGKVKAKWTLDAIVMGAKPGEGSFEGLIGAIIFGQYNEDGVLVERGKCSGMNYETRVWLTEHLDELVANRQVIEVKHNGKMESDGGGLRHPQFKCLRSDKKPEEVTVHDG